jgi:carboxylesterase type B
MNALAMSNRPFAEADHKIAETMSSYLVNFVTAGNPNGKGLATWPSVSEEPGFSMEIGDVFAPIPVAGSDAKMKLFEQYFAKPHQSPSPRRISPSGYRPTRVASKK